jgi:hypothetical protein
MRSIFKTLKRFCEDVYDWWTGKSRIRAGCDLRPGQVVYVGHNNKAYPVDIFMSSQIPIGVAANNAINGDTVIVVSQTKVANYLQPTYGGLCDADSQAKESHETSR